ncbi:uncharacterized protein [Dermacentor albipictus]|uniref:uncharacterized protein n=1 Tax=Dermacentor albipictus TaxID=60249 RepID=UPI0038FC0BB8
MNLRGYEPLLTEDTVGPEHYDRLRPLSYPDTDVILTCFSIDSPDSLENNPESGKPGVRHVWPSVHVVLAGIEGPVHAVEVRQGEEQQAAGALRPVSAAVVLRNGRHPHVLQHRLARLPGEQPGVWEAGGTSRLAQRACRSCGDRRPRTRCRSSPRRRTTGSRSTTTSCGCCRTTQKRTSSSRASASTRPTPWRTTRSLGSRGYVTSGPACMSFFRGSKALYTLSKFAKAKNNRQQEHYDQLRLLSYYSETDVILTCFSIDSPDSLENNPESGKPEVRHVWPSVQVVLAGIEGSRTRCRSSPRRRTTGSRSTTTGCGRCRTQKRTSSSRASATTRPTPWRTTRSLGSRVYVTSGPACRSFLRGSKVPVHAVEVRQGEEQQAAGALRPVAAAVVLRNGRHPHVLQHRLARFPGEQARAREAGGTSLLLQHASHYCGRRRPYVLSKFAKAKNKMQLEGYNLLRPLSYPYMDVILTCFSIDSPDSLENNPKSGRPGVRNVCRSVYSVYGGRRPRTRCRSSPWQRTTGSRTATICCGRCLTQTRTSFSRVSASTRLTPWRTTPSALGR